MPNQRSDDQVLLPITAKEEYVDELDLALRKLGINNRSQFIRDAIRQRLASLGIELPVELTQSKDRFGKGGPKPKVVTSYGAEQRRERRRKRRKEGSDDAPRN